jgi:hypothetical protein
MEDIFSFIRLSFARFSRSCGINSGILFELLCVLSSSIFATFVVNGFSPYFFPTSFGK